MKKQMIVTLLVIMAFAVAGCGKKPKNDMESNQSKTEDEVGSPGETEEDTENTNQEEKIDEDVDSSDDAASDTDNDSNADEDNSETDSEDIDDNKDIESKDADSKDTDNKITESKDTNSKDTNSKDTGSKDTASNSGNKGSNKKTDKKETSDKTDKKDTDKKKSEGKDTNKKDQDRSKKDQDKNKNDKDKDKNGNENTGNKDNDNKDDNQNNNGSDNNTKPGTDRQDELNNIRDAVAAAYEDYIPSAPYDKTQMKELFGIDDSWYDAYVAETAMISVHVDTFIAIHPTKGNLEQVKTALEKYKDYLVNDSFQYPMNMAKVKAASINVIGDHVYFIMLGQVASDVVEDDRLTKFEEQNQIAVDAIKNYKSK